MDLLRERRQTPSKLRPGPKFAVPALTPKTEAVSVEALDYSLKSHAYPGYAPVIYPSSAWMACSWPEITHFTRSPIETIPITE